VSEEVTNQYDNITGSQGQNISTRDFVPALRDSIYCSFCFDHCVKSITCQWKIVWVILLRLVVPGRCHQNRGIATLYYVTPQTTKTWLQQQILISKKLFFNLGFFHNVKIFRLNVTTILINPVGKLPSFTSCWVYFWREYYTEVKVLLALFTWTKQSWKKRRRVAGTVTKVCWNLVLTTCLTMLSRLGHTLA